MCYIANKNEAKVKYFLCWKLLRTTIIQRDWSTYKSICGLPVNQVNKHLLDCCQEDLKHLLYGEYSPTQLDAARETDVLLTIKNLAVITESKLSHRLRLGDAVQSPTQTIHAYVAVLKNLARPCALTVPCTADGCAAAVDYSAIAIRDQLIKGMSSDSDRERLLAEPNSEDMPLDDVVKFLVRLEPLPSGMLSILDF